MRGFAPENVRGVIVMPPSDYVDARAFTTHEEFTVPAAAKYAVIIGTVDFYMAYGANPTAAVPADVSDGTASELVKAGERVIRQVIAGDKISVVAAGSTIVTVSYYGNAN